MVKKPIRANSQIKTTALTATTTETATAANPYGQKINNTLA